MKVEIRDGAVLIDGYVNAVERDSKVIHDYTGSFIEKIRQGAFQRALERARKTGYDIKVLLNHKYDRQLASTGDGTTVLVEDAIGLRCRCEVRDAEVVEKAKRNKLSGWSFGFLPIRESWQEGTGENKVRHREIRELELKEVSILDDRKRPAYDGTSIEMRSEDGLFEVRFFEDEVEVRDCSQGKGPDNYEYENRYMATRIGV